MVKVNQEIYKICIIHETLLVHWKLHDSWKSYMDSVDLDLYEFLEKYVTLKVLNHKYGCVIGFVEERHY